ncbi:hypothetical protein [Flavipsychrobacter stenotrophus]|uniref:hypothetical protein n=1 Tax=Flavipsychrobacter stenotrophus TaxID=2077091 RepID=UPI001374EBBB|nr:hypothetical protein [Flavipsychrobacter stenotrophus]
MEQILPIAEPLPQNSKGANIGSLTANTDYEKTIFPDYFLDVVLFNFIYPITA